MLYELWLELGVWAGFIDSESEFSGFDVGFITFFSLLERLLMRLFFLAIIEVKNREVFLEKFEDSDRFFSLLFFFWESRRRIKFIFF